VTDALPARRSFTERAEPRVQDAARDAAELTARVSAVGRGAARAAVLGINDGLVTNLCLILAVAGADIGATEVRIAGLASLIAGAFSMAAGEWISVRSQVELYEGIVAEIRALTRRNPGLVLDELTASLVDTGLATDTAQRVATELPLDDQRFIDFSARNVFGFDTEQLGSPMTAAMSSLGLFAIGAVIPLVPWFVTEGMAAIVASVIATAIASVIVGAWVSRSSGRPILHGALRQLAIVVVVAAVTYAIGALFGTTVT
jgi:VIT1/CCC1 family predicted Fe2+/Mn2+ transporter